MESAILIIPCYFGPVSSYLAMNEAAKVIFEKEDNYQKQTYRNRMYIYGANGRLSLNIPVKHTGRNDQHQKFREVRIENSFRWQKQHWKSLQTAYRSSPFFEFFEDDFAPLYEKNFRYLMDFNEATLNLALKCLGLEIDMGYTKKYEEHPTETTDLRHLVRAKSVPPVQLLPYSQVFQAKFGFENDLSIVDLIFNEGPNALNYLDQHK